MQCSLLYDWFDCSGITFGTCLSCFEAYMSYSYSCVPCNPELCWRFLDEIKRRCCPSPVWVYKIHAKFWVYDKTIQILTIHSWNQTVFCLNLLWLLHWLYALFYLWVDSYWWILFFVLPLAKPTFNPNAYDLQVEGTGLKVAVRVRGKGGAKPRRARKTRGADDQQVFSCGGNATFRTSNKVRINRYAETLLTK